MAYEAVFEADAAQQEGRECVKQACNHLLVSACTTSVVTVVNSVRFPQRECVP